MDHPATQYGNASAWLKLKSPSSWLILVPVDFERDDVGKARRRKLSADTARVFTWLGGCAISATGRYRLASGLCLQSRTRRWCSTTWNLPRHSPKSKQLEAERTEQLKKIDERSVSRFRGRLDFSDSSLNPGFGCHQKTSISRRSHVRFGRAVQDSRPDTLVFMLSTLSTS